MNEHKRKMNRRAFLGGAATFGAVCLANPTLAFAVPTAAQKQAEADAVRDQLIAMQLKLEKASNDYYAAIDEHDKAVEAKDAAQVRIDEISGKIGDVQDKLGTRARSMYRSGSISFLEVLFAARTFQEFTDNWNILNQMNQTDAEMVQESKDLRSAVEDEKAEYARQEGIAEQKTAEALVIKEDSEKTVTEMQTLLDTLDAEAKELLEAERRAAEEAEAARQRAALAAQQASSNGGGGGGGYTSGAPIPSQGGVIDYAISRLGCPYVWGATGPDTFDCSGLTSWCYKQIGMWITRTTETQKANARGVYPVGQAQPGDVLYRYGHVGLATVNGGGTYIHAPQTGDVVRYANNGSSFACALRF